MTVLSGDGTFRDGTFWWPSKPIPEINHASRYYTTGTHPWQYYLYCRTSDSIMWRYYLYCRASDSISKFGALRFLHRRYLGVTLLSGCDSILPVTAFFSKNTVVAFIAGGILDWQYFAVSWQYFVTLLFRRFRDSILCVVTLLSWVGRRNGSGEKYCPRIITWRYFTVSWQYFDGDGTFVGDSIF